MAAAAAVQQVAVSVAVTVVSVGTSGESGGGQHQGMRGGGLQFSPRAHLVSARPGQSHQTHPAHPRPAAFSSFFGAGLDPCVLRASNGSAGSWPTASIVNEVAVDATSNSSATDGKASHPVLEAEPASSETPTAISSSLETASSVFMADIANLVKLVDSRDIVELEVKHKDYELLIRKKEALPTPPAPPQMSFPGPHVMAHTSFPAFAPPPPPPVNSLAASAPAPAAPSEVPTAPPAAEYPPMLSPMAGTFYRSPGPGESSFVKVGDKVTKGQVLCIVEAMKLMNEIEADQSGTIMDILADDGKPVSIETPLFVIKP